MKVRRNDRADDADGLMQGRRKDRADDADGLMRVRRNSIANVLELRLSCTKPSMWTKP